MRTTSCGLQTITGAHDYNSLSCITQSLKTVISPQISDAVVQYFHQVDALDATLSQKILRFVLENQAAEVLLCLPKVEQLALHLGLIHDPKNWEQAMEARNAGRYPSTLYEKLVSCDDAEFHWRLIQVFAALAKSGNFSRNQWNAMQIPPNFPEWLGLLLEFTMRDYRRGTLRGRAKQPRQPGALTLSRMLAIDQIPPELPLKQILDADSHDWIAISFREIFEQLFDFKAYLGTYPSLILTSLHQSNAQGRAHILELCHRHEIATEFMETELLDYAICDAKGLQRQAEAMVKRWGELGIEKIAARLGQGTPKNRLKTAQLLHRLAGDTALPYLSAQWQVEPHELVKTGLMAMLHKPASPEPETITLPPSPELQLTAQLDDSIEPIILDILRAAWERIQSDWLGQRLPQTRKHPQPLPDPPDFAALAATLRHWLNHLTAHHCPSPSPFAESVGGYQFVWYLESEKLYAHPQFRLIHHLRWRCLLNPLLVRAESPWSWTEDAELIAFLTQQGYGLRELAVGLDALGIPTFGLGRHYLYDYFIHHRYSPEFLWPYFATHLALLDEALRGGEGQNRYFAPQTVRQRALEVLQTFPTLPLQFVNPLFHLAIEGGKQERLLARQALASVLDRLPRLYHALEAKQQTVRQNAAEWLGQLKDAAALPALETALQKEKHEATKATMLIALENLGGDLSRYVNPQHLEAEAEVVLQKGIPKELGWLGFNRLPPLRWHIGESVNPRIVHSWIVSAYKLKNVDPKPLLKHYFAQINAQDAQDLATFILESWVTQDTRTVSQIEAEDHAQRELPQFKQWMPNQSDEEILQKLIQGRLNQCIGSAIKEKGILSLVATVQPPRLLPITQQFVQKWGGNRHHQSQALLTALSWSDQPAAIQWLLTMTRSRIKSLRTLASEKVQILADRQGWTLDQLADRTLPTAGLDEMGQLSLDYGRTQFIATLTPKMKFFLTRKEDGKPMNSLPAARQGDDPELVKAAKAELNAAKKELASFLQQQPPRLYEAMTMQRKWKFAEWERYFARHPLMRFLLQRTLWIAHVGQENQENIVFRLLEDGSLTDADDNAVHLTAEIPVSLAHGTHLTPEQRTQWHQHAQDYGVDWLFNPLNAPNALDTLDLNSREITEFKGYMMDAFTLRGELTKQGFNRGEAEDGGWFSRYLKPFPGCHLQMEIEFTGNALPEENRQIALIALKFLPFSPQGEAWQHSFQTLKLAEVPSLLLAEGYELLHRLAQKSRGFDPEWEKKAFL